MTMSKQTSPLAGSAGTVLVLAAPFVLLLPGLAGTPGFWVLAAVALGLLGVVQTTAARTLRAMRLETAALTAFCLALCLILYGGWLDAKWSIIDDHELFFYLDGRSRLGFLDALRAFAGHYEVGGILGNSLGRFRPGYYLVRFANLWLFAGDVAWWDRFDFAVLALSLCLAALTLRRVLGLAETVLALIAMLSLPFWPGVLFSNLQQESVALLGLCLCAHGLARVRPTRSAPSEASAPRSQPALAQTKASRPQAKQDRTEASRPPAAPVRTKAMRPQWASLGARAGQSARAWPGAWTQACFGAVLAMSLKENFLFLAPLLLVAAAFAKRRGALPRPAVIRVAAALAYAVLACAVLAFLLARLGADMYANPVSAAARLPLLLPGLARYASLAQLHWTLPALAPFLALGLAANRRGRYPSFRGDAARAALALAVCAYVFVSQYVFYDGQILRSAQRYDFPALLAPPCAWLAFAWLASRCLRHAGKRALRRLAPVFVCAGLAAFAAHNGFDPWRSQLRLALDKTQIFEARLGAVALLAQAEPARPLVLYARDPDSIEAVDSVLVYLRKRFSVANPIFLDYQGPHNLAPRQIYLHNLDTELARLSRQGSADLTPLNQLPAGSHPLGLGFDGPPGPDAANLGRIWPLP